MGFFIARNPDSFHKDYDKELSDFSNENPELPKPVSERPVYEFEEESRDAQGRMRMMGYLVVALALGLIVCASIMCSPECAGAEEADAVVIETIARESSGESLLAQAYVGKVIRERSTRRKLSPKEVCLQRRQFSCWDKGTKQKPRTAREFEKARKAWDMSKSITDRPTHYHDVSVRPYWVKKMVFVRKVGRLLFYREA